ALADTGPILIFLCFYLFCFCRHFAGLSGRQSLVALALFLALNALIIRFFPGHLVNHSHAYFGSLLALVAMALFLLHRKNPLWPRFVMAAILFMASLFFRSIDEAICNFMPLGSHFLWHILNAAILYHVTKALMLVQLQSIEK